MCRSAQVFHFLPSWILGLSSNLRLPQSTSNVLTVLFALKPGIGWRPWTQKTACLVLSCWCGKVLAVLFTFLLSIPLFCLVKFLLITRYPKMSEWWRQTPISFPLFLLWPKAGSRQRPSPGPAVQAGAPFLCWIWTPVRMSWLAALFTIMGLTSQIRLFWES